MTQKRNDNGQIEVNFNIFSRLRILELLVRSVQGVFGFLGTIFYSCHNDHNCLWVILGRYFLDLWS